MGHLSFSDKNIGLNDLAISSARLVDKLVVNTNQEIYSVDKLVHGDKDLPFGSQKSGNKMSVDFRQNTDDKFGVNPSITIGIPQPQIIRSRVINCNIFDSVSRPSYLSYMGSTWHRTIKSES